MRGQGVQYPPLTAPPRAGRGRFLARRGVFRLRTVRYERGVPQGGGPRDRALRGRIVLRLFGICTVRRTSALRGLVRLQKVVVRV